MQTQVKNAREIGAMRMAGKMLAQVLRAVAPAVAPGVSTKELADIAAKELKALGGKPSFLGYQGFPDVLCVSVNEAIVHGIPSPKKLLVEGDIVGLDFGVTYDGMITDGAISVGVGKLRPQVEQLLVATQRSLEAGIATVRDKVQVGDISSAIEQSIRKAGSYGIPKDLVGHGVGHRLWEEPNIPNYGRRGSGPMLSSGMTIAIEPMVTLGTDKIQLEADGWTITTADGSWAAHFEHTVLITNDGCEILTR
jgi:methionyl aminopeptidase